MPRNIITSSSLLFPRTFFPAALGLLASVTCVGCAEAYASTGNASSTGTTDASFAAPTRETRDAGQTEASTTTSYSGPFSPLLRGGKLRSPMPGGFLGGWNGDTGLDIAGNRLDVYAIGAGTLDYSEWGHTLWTRGRDTPYSVRLALDEPIPWGKDSEHKITHVYYTHLSKVETQQAEGTTPRKHVEAGEKIAVSGIGNGVPHLHLGLLLDNEVEQDSWTFILREGDIRKVFGNYKYGELLPLK